jgi:hypothetical protein
MLLTRISHLDSLKAPADESLRVEDSIARVHRGLIFGGIPN